MDQQFADVMNLVALHQPDALAPRCQQTLMPIEVNGSDYLEIKALALNASSFTTVHLVATKRDNSKLDHFAHGQRNLLVCKRIRTHNDAGREAAAVELAIYERLNLHPDAARRMIRLIEKEEAGGELVLLMEYGGGGTLEGWEPEDASELISTCATMLRCLEWLHGLNVAHLDIKPANFVFAAGRLKLIDFGVARHFDSADGVLKLDTPFPGTVDYLPPEAIVGRADPSHAAGTSAGEAEGRLTYEVSAKTDIWALGCVVCKLATGHTPFPPREDRGGDLTKQREALAAAPMHLAKVRDRLASLPKRGIGDVTEELVSICVITSPSQRPSAKQLLNGQLFEPRTVIKSGATQHAVSLSNNARVPLVRRQVTFTAPDKTDLLFHIFAFEESPKRLFTARRVCK